MSLYVDVQVPGRLGATVTAGDGVTAVVGPNGSGKSSLLAAVAGVLPGTVRVGAGDWTGLPPQRRRVGLVAQDLQLFPHLTALDNVAFGPRARGTGRRAARERSREWLARLGIADLADRRPHELSGGQAQRVGFARALATDPEVLLLDEPFAALDLAVAEELREVLREHLVQFPGTVLLATHDALDVTELATDVVVLETGALAQTGRVDAVAAAPATPHAARLLGLNVLVGSSDGAGFVTSGERGLVTTSSTAGPVLATFAPTAVTLAGERPVGSARNAWPLRVVATTAVGTVVRVHLRSDGGWDVRADVTPSAAGQLGLAPGVLVWASVKATEIGVFSTARSAEQDVSAR